MTAVQVRHASGGSDAAGGRLRLTVEVWRQDSASAPGRFERYELDDLTAEMSILELLDRLNAKLVDEGREPVAFDHDCREGICGTCGCVVNGKPHGPKDNTPSCLQRLWSFHNGDTVVLEPFRAAAMPVVRDLIVDRAALDGIIASGGYVSTSTGTAPEATAIGVDKPTAEAAMDMAACIGCAACVAACPNASPMLFVAAKVAHLSLLPQGQVERRARVAVMVAALEDAGFGACSNHGDCATVCPAEIPLHAIATLNRELLSARWNRRLARRR